MDLGRASPNMTEIDWRRKELGLFCNRIRNWMAMLRCGDIMTSKQYELLYPFFLGSTLVARQSMMRLAILGRDVKRKVSLNSR